MTNRYDELINAFEIKLRKLVSEYLSLQTQHNKLQNDLMLKQESLISAHGEILELRKKNEHLSMANQLSGSEEGRAEAKKTIDKMVREIDKCLALINE